MSKEKNELPSSSAGKMEKIVSLCKRRGFVFPGSEIYGGLANSWDFGPLGVELKNNIKNVWWKRFVQQRDDMVGIDASLIMNTKVWENSGHLKEFSDPLVECDKCKRRFRADHIDSDYEKNKKFNKNIKCPDCKGNLSEPRQFNLMLKTFIGPAEEKANVAYFRPETAQAMFVDFKNVLNTTRRKLPFGIAQIGKAFRNEVTPGNFIFRTREFEQMEIEYFIPKPMEDNEWQSVFNYWQKEMWSWCTENLGLKKENLGECECEAQNRAHYSKKTIDIEYNYPFGKSELYGLAYRTDFDLKNHFPDSPYEDAEAKEKFYPHVIEPTFGVDRSVLAVLLDAYTEEKDRVVLKIKPSLAPYKIAVFPLLRNKPELVKKAKEIFDVLKMNYMCEFDDNGNIGKRYRRQDEIGTPYCVTVDFDSLNDKAVTVRDRDTMKQERIAISELAKYFEEKLKN
ncbi:MAG TPA: glycine--tRNA ligase [Candidatus Moranbacteria bacterium]|nr:glycine--tRNA ligase [Candidatus Moranbacteria bacterium]